MTNRVAYILYAVGRHQEVDGTFRSFCQDAFDEKGGAAAATAAFLERVVSDDSMRIVTPDATTLQAKTQRLSLVEDMDASGPTDRIFMLTARGREGSLGGEFFAIHRRAFSSRNAADEAVEGFRDACLVPGGRADTYAEEDSLRISVQELGFRSGANMVEGA